MQALRQHKVAEPLHVEMVPIPQAEPGSAIIEILNSYIFSYTRELLDGTRTHGQNYIAPSTAGMSAVGRIHSLGPDATALKVGQLVMTTGVLRGRDDAINSVAVSGVFHGPAGGQKLMQYWPDGPFAEYQRYPLENILPLDENRLIKELGYSTADLTYIAQLGVPFSGLSDIDLKAGETVVIAPATGGFGGAAVRLALAIGAKVIAMGRNKEKLAELKDLVSKQYPADRLVTVPITGDLGQEMGALAEAAGSSGIDAFFDISPAQGANGSYFKAAILALKPYGRVSLMGGQAEDVAIPYQKVMFHQLRLTGTWMFTADVPRRLINLIEKGVVPLGKKAGLAVPKEFALKDWKEAFDHALGDNLSVFVPSRK
jgi:threonine dehydrogenase-like Zn-dependent dehydrogenase